MNTRKTLPMDKVKARLQSLIDCDRQSAENMRNDGQDKSAAQWEMGARTLEMFLEEVKGWEACEENHIFEYYCY